MKMTFNIIMSFRTGLRPMFLGRVLTLGLALSLILLISGVPPCEAQAPVDLPSIHGKILDPNRAAIAGARITAQGPQGNLSVVSDRTGNFSLTLAPGEYIVTANADGFAETSRTFKLNPMASESLEMVLPIAGSTATVTIMGADTLAYRAQETSSATKTLTPLRDLPQSITVVTNEQIRDQSMESIADVVNYVPGITSHQGENNRDQLVIRGNSTSADFFLNGVRDDVQYYRDLYNINQLEILKGPNAMIFGRGGGGGVVNRVTKEASFSPSREVTLQGGSFGNRRFTGDIDQALSRSVAFRLNGLYERFGSFRRYVNLERYGIN